MVIFLTKTGGLLGPFAYVFGLIMNGIYNVFNLIGIQNIALTIIIFTFITRALMLPLTIKQQKFTKLSSVMNPEIQKIQAKYKGKKDEVSLKKQQEETQIVYQKYGANPTAGCLPLLITLPIMFALYAVIRNIPAYVDHVYKLYEYIAIQVQTTSGYQETLTTLAGTVSKTAKVGDLTTINGVIDVLSKFNSEAWKAFATSFPTIQNSIANGDSFTVADSINSIKNVNGFLGFNVADSPGWTFPAILIPIIAGLLQFVQTKQIQVKTSNTNQDNPMAASMKSMNYVMPLMSAFFCVTFPIGIGLYWISSSLFAIVQQFFVNKYMDRIDVNDLIKKNLSKPSKKNKYLESKGITMSDLAKKQTKSIDTLVTEKVIGPVKEEAQKSSYDSEKNNQESKYSTSGKSISEIANLLKSRNEKGDK